MQRHGFRTCVCRVWHG